MSESSVESEGLFCWQIRLAIAVAIVLVAAIPFLVAVTALLRVVLA
jgi:hypothetical protein